MIEDLPQSIVVGTKQVLKAIAAGRTDRVFMAADVDAYLANKIRQVCTQNAVQICEVASMHELGKACKIDVGAACAAALKTEQHT